VISSMMLMGSITAWASRSGRRSGAVPRADALADRPEPDRERHGEGSSRPSGWGSHSGLWPEGDPISADEDEEEQRQSRGTNSRPQAHDRVGQSGLEQVLVEELQLARDPAVAWRPMVNPSPSTTAAHERRPDDVEVDVRRKLVLAWSRRDGVEASMPHRAGEDERGSYEVTRCPDGGRITTKDDLEDHRADNHTDPRGASRITSPMTPRSMTARRCRAGASRRRRTFL